MYFFRYEDLVANPYHVTREVFEFVLGVKSIEDTYLDHRIKQVIGQRQAASTLYKPRSGSVNGNLTNYNDEQIAHIMKQCRQQLLFFGYAKTPEGTN